MLFKIKAPLLFGLSLFLLSCSQLSKKPHTEDHRYRLHEHEMVRSYPLNRYLADLLSTITDHHKRKALNLIVADTYDAQAMAQYDNKSVYISRGMLYAIQNEAELAAILAHEIGHFQLKHGLTAKKQSENEKQNLEKITEIFEGLSRVEIPHEMKARLEEIRQAQFTQKNEQSADEFAALTTHQIGYDPYAYALLLERLDSLDDRSRSKQILSLDATHKNLGQRAQHIRKFLESKQIEPSGKLNTKSYLTAARNLVRKSENAEANKRIDEVLKELSNIQSQNRPLSLEEFLRLMTELHKSAAGLGILPQIQSAKYSGLISEDSNAKFMMEWIRLLQPLWAKDPQTAQKLFSAFHALGKLGVGTIPVVGDAIDLYEVIVGRDYFTDQELSTTDRISSALGVIAGAGQQWRSAAKGLGQIHAMAESNNLPKKYRLIKNDESRKAMQKLAEEIQGKKIPDSWGMRASKDLNKKAQGLVFTHPDHTDVMIRVMPGDPKAKYTNSKSPYVRQTAGKKSFDKNGNAVNAESPEAHIPLNEYNFTEFWKKR